MVAKGRQCPHRPTITPNKTCSANFYRCIKRRVGHSLKRIHCQKGLVTARKQAAYKLSGTKSSLSSFKRVSRPLYRQDSTCGNRQHHSSVLHKQGRGHEVGPTLWHRAQIDLFATRFNYELPLFVSPAPDPLATAVDALSLPWEDLDAYAFPPAAILGKVVEKLQDSPCKSIILIAPGWPNMPWFWDPVAMSSQIPLSLPNLPNSVRNRSKKSESINR